MTSQRAILSLLSLAVFPAIIVLLFIGQSYLSTKYSTTPVADASIIPPPAVPPPPTGGSPGQLPSVAVDLLLRQSIQLMEQNQFDAALDKVNIALQTAPHNPAAYALRGDIYAAKKLWDPAERDYQTVLQIDGTSVQIKFNLGEIEFAQKKYDAARSHFAVLQQDPAMGDLAAYKVFLCDLFGEHEKVAAKELDAFNQVGAHASYYFANAAWSLYHQKKDDARGWLVSAGHIYTPAKFKLYADSLIGVSYPERLNGPLPSISDPSTHP